MANKELGAIRDAWSKDSGEGRDEEKARKLADAYVKANPDQFETLEDLSVDQLVKAVDVFREAGMEDDQWRVEAWLLHRYEPQTIGGAAEPKVRLV